MQGTVKEFSEQTRSGSVILDDGTVIPVPADAFSRSGLRKLQAGQRVRFETEQVDGAPLVTSITLATL